jgi:hypothetical protein
MLLTSAWTPSDESFAAMLSPICRPSKEELEGEPKPPLITTTDLLIAAALSIFICVCMYQPSGRQLYSRSIFSIL